jgi:hypothetical protein
MTVFNTSYSTIHEAWGDNYLSPSLQKKQKKKKIHPQSDPICDLYENGNNSYNDTDIVSYANKFYEKYEKGKYQKPRMLEREQQPRIVDFGDSPVAPHNKDVVAQMKQMIDEEEEDITTYYDTYSKSEKQASPQQLKVHATSNPENDNYHENYQDDEEEDGSKRYTEKFANKTSRDKILYDTHEYYLGEEDPDFYKKNMHFNYFDVILYIISGIILIFMMEQFVKVGMLLH